MWNSAGNPNAACGFAIHRVGGRDEGAGDDGRATGAVGEPGPGIEPCGRMLGDCAGNTVGMSLGCGGG